MKDFLSMTIYKNNNGGLLLYAPFSINDDHIKEIESLGKPEIIIIPNENEYSYKDVHLYKENYPESKVVCPESIKEKIKEHIHIDTSIEEWIKTDHIDYINIINPKLKSFEGIVYNLHIINYYIYIYMYLLIIKKKENVYEIELKNDQKAIIWGEILWNLKCKTGVIWKTLAIMGAAGDGKQPQLPIVHRNFGFENKNEMKKFFIDMYNKIKTKRENKQKSFSELTNVEDVQEIIESSDEKYPIMIYQHGEPTILRSGKKIEKIIETL